MYELPTSVNVCGTDYDIETDFRAILDIFCILEDPDLTGNEKGVGMLGIFYKRFLICPQSISARLFKNATGLSMAATTKSAKTPQS